MAGFREFVTGEVLTASNVDDYLAKQAVMKFADAAARNTALGTAVGGSNALREGMVAYLDDTNDLLKYDGAAWGTIGGPFDARADITATDASWPVPSLGSPIVRVTVVGGGGGGGGGLGGNGASGGTSSAAGAGITTISASGGVGGKATHGAAYVGPDGPNGWSSNNGGYGGSDGNRASGYEAVVGQDGKGGQVVVDYSDLTGLSTLNVTIGGGGAGGTTGNDGGAGGAGVVVIEYKAG